MIRQLLKTLTTDGEDFPATPGRPPIDGRQWLESEIESTKQNVVVFPRYQQGIVLQQGPPKPIRPFVDVDNTLAEAFAFVYTHFIKDGE